MKKIFTSLFIFGLLLILLTACSAKTETAEPVSAEPVIEVLIAEGRVLPSNSMSHAFTTPGKVVEVLVKDGEAVEVGQVLARLENSPDLSASLSRAQQNVLAAQQAVDALKEGAAPALALAQAKLAELNAAEALEDAEERFDVDESEENGALLAEAREKWAMAETNLAVLEDNDGIDPDQMALADANLSSANMSLEAAQAAFSSRELKAEIAGTVIDLALEVGQFVAAGVPVIDVADLSAWNVETENLTEVDVVQLEVGQEATVVLDALPEVELKGKIVNINQRYEIKRGDVTFTVTVALDPTDQPLRWGMTAAVRFTP